MRTIGIKKAVTATLFALTGLIAGATMQVSLTDAVAPGGCTATVEVQLTSDTPLSGLQLLFDVPAGSGVSFGDVEGAGRAASFSGRAGIREGRASVMLFNASGAQIAAGKGLVARFAVNYGTKPLDANVAVTVKAVGADGAAVAVPTGSLRLLCRQPQAEYSLRAIDYGRVPLGSRPTSVVTMTNTGTAPLVVTAIDFADAIFSTTASLPLTVAPGMSAPVEVTFAPEERGTVESAMKLTCNSPQTYNTVILKALPYSVNEVHVGSATGTAGEEVTIDIAMNNMDAVNGFTLEFDLPDALKYVDGSFALGDRGAAHSLQVNTVGNKLIANAYSLTNTPFEGADGVLASFRVRLQGKGSQSVSPSKCRLSAFYRGEVMDVTSGAFGGSVDIAYPTISVNGSHELGRTPVTETCHTELTVSNYGNAPLTIHRIVSEHPDVNVATELPLTIAPWSNSKLAVEIESDNRGAVEGRLNIYSNDPDCEFVAVAYSGERYSPNELTFAVASASGQTDLTVLLDNNDATGGIQFDVQAPEGCTLGEPAAMGRMEGFTVTHRTLANGNERFFVYSMAGRSAEKGSGAVVRLPYTTTAGAGSTFTVSNVRISTPAMQNVASATAAPFFLLGDVNADRRVDVVDITEITNSVSAGFNGQFIMRYADMNFDNLIDVSDITEIGSMISGN